MVELEASQKSHEEVVQSRKEARTVHRTAVRSGDRYGYLLTGAHPMFNIREEIDMLADPKRGISRVEDVYVRTNRRGREVIELYTPDGQFEAYPDTNSVPRDEIKEDKICGREILIFPRFVPQVTKDNIKNYPETDIPAEFEKRKTEQLLENEL